MSVLWMSEISHLQGSRGTKLEFQHTEDLSCVVSVGCMMHKDFAFLQSNKYAHVENTNSVFPAKLESLKQTYST